MGTNYYGHKLVCAHCGRMETVHLGKNSAGWTFSFQATAEVKNLQHWINQLFHFDSITDEYNTAWSIQEMIEIALKTWPKDKKHALEYPSAENWLDEYGASFTINDFC